MQDTIKQRLMKIYNLAQDEGATEDEKRHALRKLEQLLDRYGFTIDDLKVGTAQEYRFKYNRKWEFELLIQLIARVIGQTSLTYDKFRNFREIAVQLTQVQYQEISHLFPIYKKAYQQELDDLMKAFFHKHDLLVPSDDVEFDMSGFDFGAYKRVIEKSKYLSDVSTSYLLES